MEWRANSIAVVCCTIKLLFAMLYENSKMVRRLHLMG